ncbi:hypothetical protein FMJ72_26005 [Klebsiella pneumoniae]|nr:hypothetical protein [Klebsiella pneumoniae]MBZ6694653.1 hypothetical protein [Klebsiella pneumoniae]MBZ6699685.1 hypothetical protein [Klebsiella pneumoniae]MBZ6726366.1 hypothetical protein [Klebsiella pneumoniae]MBZ6753247.1 hypothetical protein [Klebsiella pneumoniae]
MFSESGFTHSDLLRGHNQYVGRSLKVNGAFYRDTYNRLNRCLYDPGRRLRKNWRGFKIRVLL